MGLRADPRLDICESAIKKFGERQPARLDIDAALHLGEQASAFDLSLTLRALEAVPFAFLIADGSVVLIKDDRAMAGRAVTNGRFPLKAPTELT